MMLSYSISVLTCQLLVIPDTGIFVKLIHRKVHSSPAMPPKKFKEGLEKGNPAIQSLGIDTIFSPYVKITQEYAKNPKIK